MHPTFIKPRYDEGGFAGIPGRIKGAFASGKYDAVVLFLVDGFGWRFFERFQDAPFLQRMAKQGNVEKLLSQFPSTTAAHLTTIHTGWNVGQSGVYEWIYYEPLVDAIIAPLLFSYSGLWERDLLKPTGIQPAYLYPRGMFYPELEQMGVKPFVFGIRDYTPSTYSRAVMDGAELRAFKTFSEALINVGLLLKKQQQPTYVYLYFDKIDALGHEYGPTAPQTEAEIETFLLTMEHYFERVFQGKRILFLMTADHGQTEIDPQTTIYLNKGPQFTGVERFLRTNLKGQLLVPAGSPRDMFLYIKDDMLDDAQSFLELRLEGKADVVKTKILIEAGYFGPDVSPRFRERVGNLVILPYRYESVWWYEKDKFEQRFYGHHGGLTPEEMETVLYSYEIE
ncbi:MAG TPA: alkaline phosphatase family protein [Anaerolineales bacterium]|jgi:predicted AlkP superfamily pyrophosphatase or phosphodiesterase|nr:alkaline phosphatase family protein [Anaerolineales bacterium]